LHLVIQQGRLFQQAHPNVSVLLDRGRFLVIELDAGSAREYATEGFPCWSVSPLEDNSVVFDVRRLDPSTRPAPVAWVQSLVSFLERPALEADLAHLVSFPNRFSTGPHFRAAADWAESQLKSLGYVSHREPIMVNGGTSQNVIAEKGGAEASPRLCVIIIAHLDSVNSNGGPSAIATRRGR
jgi:hypothetical protein